VTEDPGTEYPKSEDPATKYPAIETLAIKAQQQGAQEQRIVTRPALADPSRRQARPDSRDSVVRLKSLARQARRKKRVSP
jgi:hypothetical protein